MDAASTHLDDGERLARLRLIRTENVGPVTFRQLLARYGSAATALAALPELSRRGGRRSGIRLCSPAEAEAELAAASACGARLIAAGEPAYPALLAHIADAPPLIYVRGRPEALTPASVAMVGARNASANGVRFARDLAGDLGQAGLTVVSGLARGIDTAAHRGALATGTVAVLAGGVDHVYPPENADLYREIAEAGAVVSERPPGYAPQARDFPRRNRLISGLALGVVVVEAAIRSGSLITARLAGEQGREVFAVPGSPLDPRARGSNSLIRQGAVLTEQADDITAVLRPMIETGSGAFAAKMSRFASGPMEFPEPIDSVDVSVDTDRRDVVALLSPTPVDVDELMRQAQLTPAQVMTILLELELAGRLSRHTGNRVSIS